MKFDNIKTKKEFDKLCENLDIYTSSELIDSDNILTPEQKEMYIKRAQYRHRKNMHIIQEQILLK